MPSDSTYQFCILLPIGIIRWVGLAGGGESPGGGQGMWVELATLALCHCPQDETGLSAVPDPKYQRLVGVMSAGEAEQVLRFLESPMDSDTGLMLEPDDCKEHRTKVPHYHTPALWIHGGSLPSPGALPTERAVWCCCV